MNVRTAIACILGITGLAMGQNHAIYTVDKEDYRADLSTAPSLAVGLEQVVVVGSHRMMMFDKSQAIDPMNPQDVRNWGPIQYSPTYPFLTSSPSSGSTISALIYPRAEFDPITGNVWILYSQASGTESTDPVFEPARPEFGGGACIRRLHIAASRRPDFDSFNVRLPGVIPPVPDPFGFTYWTGSTAIPEPDLGGAALNLNLPLLPYDPNHVSDHFPVQNNLLNPSMGFDTNHVIIVADDSSNCVISGLQGDPTGCSQVILFIPRVFDEGGVQRTIHDGGRISETDITIARMTGEPLIADAGCEALVVQEPYEQYENITLIISTDGTTFGGVGIQGIRLKGVFWDDMGTPDPSDDRWQVRQRVIQIGTQWQVDDMLLTGMELLAIKHSPLPFLFYPKAPNGFTPTLEDESFATAVLTRDNMGNPRVFAAHAGVIADSMLGTRWVVQWYLIDPDFGSIVTPPTNPPRYTKFHNAPLLSETWRPSIVEMGRIESDEINVVGDCYLPALGVTRSGQAFVEYTFSNETIDPKIVRKQVLPSSFITVPPAIMQAGPPSGYGQTDDRWALYSDLQADPTLCRFWSTHTLVEDEDTRLVWMFQRNFPCFSLDLNANGLVDPFDLLLYTDWYISGDERADTDMDGVVDAVDMANYLNAYQEATQP
ncbi:MAG: hypothetical protein KIT54_02140 [Phycisphaeraceae bacterium]|nr:hypothetical protein [Phycisphaeraceae bacterium]